MLKECQERLRETTRITIAGTPFLKEPHRPCLAQGFCKLKNKRICIEVGENLLWFEYISAKLIESMCSQICVPEDPEGQRRIYISGPISTRKPKEYLSHFAKIENSLMLFAYNFTVVNPAKILAQLPIDTSYAEYMDLSMLLLSRCEYIYMLSGWENSVGARLEFRYAKDNNLTILYEDDDSSANHSMA